MDGAQLGVVTARVERPGQRQLAEALVAELGARFIERRGRSAQRVIVDEELTGLLVANEERLHHVDREGRVFFWHPNMALVRLQSAHRAGLPDPLARAALLQPGDRFLDATFGLGADALVASFYVGRDGCVLGLEAAPVVVALARHGLARFSHRWAPHVRNISLQVADYNAVWADDILFEPGFDVIYFDPMFDQPVATSSGLDGLRGLACHASLSAESLSRARSRAERSVVVKGRGNDPWLSGLQPDRWVQGRHRRVAYAVFESG